MEGGILDRFLTATSKVLNVIGGSALTFMMCLTVADVLMRTGGHPILGTYEIVGLALALVIGFGIPKVSMDRGHVYHGVCDRQASQELEGHIPHIYPHSLHRPLSSS